MKKFLTIIIAILTAVSCTNLDEVWAELREHEERIERLETECLRLNSNIEALQAVLEAAQSKDYITDIVKIMEDGVEIGYSITFAKGGIVNIYHGRNGENGEDGKDGQDGTAPKIGIRKASDGEYYWTADDQWLTDEQGEKIPATSQNGNYTTPLFRVADGEWYISYDGGNTWQVIEEVKGNDETTEEHLVIDWGNISWTQGHYDGNGNFTGVNGTYYNYRIKTEVMELPSAITDYGGKLVFYVNDNYEVNIRYGVGNNASNLTNNYYLITSDRSVEDRGVNSGNRGYVVRIPKGNTHYRMMVSKDDGSSTGSNLIPITPDESAYAVSKIEIKPFNSLDVTYDGQYLYVTLADGTIITIPSESAADNSGETKIPDYWKAHIDGKIRDINATNELNGGDGDSFIFLTDTHFPLNSGNSVALIRYIIENTSVRKVFIGGDIINGNQGNEKDMALLRSVKRDFAGIDIFPVRGNHDADASEITDSQWYDVFTRDLADYCTISDKLYYYHDNPAQKIRYIFADSIWGYGKYAASEYLISDEQLAWIKERILELSYDWTVLMTKHHLWSLGSEGTLNSEGRRIVDHLNTYYYDAKCSIAGIFAGHSHSDHSVYASQGYVLTSTLGDNTTVSGWKDNSTKEQAFDVVTINTKTGTIKTVRIGERGQDREYTYAVNGYLPLTGLSLKHQSLAIAPEKSRTLTAVLEPDNSTETDIEWSIESGEGVVSLAPDGLNCIVTGLKKGSAIIKASASDGAYTARCEITVKDIITEDITEQFIFTEGRMIYAHNGKDTAHSGWIASDYTDISNYSLLEIKMSKTASTTTNTGLAFYDKDKNYISGVIHYDGVATYGTMVKELEVPANAVYIRTTYWSKNHGSYKPEFGDFYCIAYI